jgi:DNA-binding PadR family transcriptional regulator
MNILLVVLTIIVLGALALVLIGRWYSRHGDRQRRLILELLEQGPAGGLALVKRSGGRLGRETVYMYLRELEDKHLIVSTYETGESGRRIYALTRLGKRIQRRLQVLP